MVRYGPLADPYPEIEKNPEPAWYSNKPTLADYACLVPPITMLGYKGERVENPYIVTVRSRDEHYNDILIIRSILQEDVQMRTSGRWEGFGLGTTLLTAQAEKMVQWIWKASTTVSWLSRRVWQGTTPIELNLSLRFEAEENELEEVVKPTLALQQLALPGRRVVRGAVGEWFLGKFGGKAAESPEGITAVYPPGPSPFRSGEGDIITIKVGDFLEFKQVVVKNIDVKYPPKFTRDGRPISSSVSVQFETYEIVTKGDLNEIYKNVSQRKISKEKEKYVHMRSKLYPGKDTVFTPKQQ